MNQLLLDVLSVVAVLSSVLVITSKNPVISVLFLVSVFVSVACYLVLMGVGFIGISYIVVYVGAVTVLFLFVIMMLNLQMAELNAVGSEYTQSLPLGIIIGFMFLVELVNTTTMTTTTSLYNQLISYVLGLFSTVHSIGESSATVSVPFQSVNADTYFTTSQQIQSIGVMLYSHASVWLMVASIILLLAMVSPIVLTKKSPFHFLFLSKAKENAIHSL